MTVPDGSPRLRWIALGGLAVALGVGALGWRLLPREGGREAPRSAAPAAAPSKAGGNPPATTIGMDTPLGDTEVSVGIEELIHDYLADQPAADERYRFKTVAVAGVLLEIDRRDPQITTVVVGKQLGGKESPCACQGGRALEQAAAGLSPGQRITVRGKMIGLEQMRMVLLNCELVPP